MKAPGIFRSTRWRVSFGFDRRSRRVGKGFLLPLLSIVALLIPSFAGVASAGINRWTTNGPEGGAIGALAIDPANPATLYAGTSGGGVFKSSNGGESWAAINAGLTNTFVYSLAVDPSAPATLYAGTFSGVFKSTDGGGTWTFIFGHNNASVVALAIDRSAPSNIYAGSAPYEWPPGGIFKSTDGGENWTDGGLSGRLVFALAIDPSAPATLYAGTDEGVFKSINRGGSWTAINAGLTNPSVGSLRIDPSAPATLYAGTAGGGVLKSSNGGGSWTAINAGLIASSVHALAIDPSAPSTLYAGTLNAGIFKSTNGGASWTAINAGLTNLFVGTLAIEPSAPATLYAGTSGGFAAGVFKSTNGGGNWTAVNTGLAHPTFPALAIDALAIDPSAPASLYAGTYAGVFKSTNGGGNWTAVNTGLAHPSVLDLAIDPTVPATLYAATGGGLFKSTNGGASWTASLPGRSVWALAIDPSVPATLYAASGGVLKSTDGGGSWTAIDTGLTSPVNALAIDPSATATLYAGTHGGGVFKSINGGASWTAMNSGLTNFPIVNALAIDPATPARIYAGTGGGVFEYLATELLDRRILPVVGSTPGASGTFFRTSVQLHNPGSASITGRIVFHPSGAAGSDTDPALSYSLDPGQTQSIADLLPAMGVSGLGSADIEITSGAAPVATARVFNDAGPSGTTGFTEEAMRTEDALYRGQPGILFIPSDFTRFRFNVGVRTLADGASVTFSVRNASGAELGGGSRSFSPSYHEQANAIGFLRMSEIPAGGSIAVYVTSGSAIFYGATVDNTTGDPSLQIARATGPWDY